MVDGFDLGPATLRLGPVRLDRVRCELHGPAGTARIDQKACQVLLVLVAARGRAVSRDEILARVWPQVTVAPGNISVQISALRGAFRRVGCTENPIQTTKLPARYQFCLTVRNEPEQAGEAFVTAASSVADAYSPASGAGHGERHRRRPSWAPAALAAGALAAGALALCAGALAYWMAAPPSAAPRQRLAIAVLPFQLAGQTEDARLLAAPLTEDLIVDLGRMPGSRVISRETAAASAAAGLSDAMIGSRLGARYVLHGTVTADAQGYAVSFYLNDVKSDSRVTGFSTDFRKADVSTLRRTLEGRIANTVRRGIENAVYLEDLDKNPASLDALALYYRALHLLNGRPTGTQADEAAALLRKVIAKDSGFAEAFAALAVDLYAKDFFAEGVQTTAERQEAAASLRTAQLLSPRNPTILAAHGFALETEQRCAESAHVENDVLDIQPSNADALTALAGCAWITGDLAAVSQYQALLEAIDPLSPSRGQRLLMLGHVDLLRGEAADAVDILKESIADYPDDRSGGGVMGAVEFAHLLLIAALQLSHQPVEARAQYADYMARYPNRSVWRIMAMRVEHLTELDAHAGVWQALAAAGMPVRGDETAPPDMDCMAAMRPLGVPPRSVPGAALYDTAAMQALASRAEKPFVIDTGTGFSSMEGAHWLARRHEADGMAHYIDTILSVFGGELSAGRQVIVMGEGAYGCDGYRATLYLLGKGFRHVGWYRGGEEAWSQTGLAIDRRSLLSEDATRQDYQFLSASTALAR